MTSINTSARFQTIYIFRAWGDYTINKAYNFNGQSDIRTSLKMGDIHLKSVYKLYDILLIKKTIFHL